MLLLQQIRTGIVLLSIANLSHNFQPPVRSQSFPFPTHPLGVQLPIRVETVQSSIGTYQRLMCNIDADAKCAGTGCSGVGCAGIECAKQFRWIRLAGCQNNGMIASRGRFRISGPTLQIAQLQNHDAGLWGCMAYDLRGFVGYRIFQIMFNSANVWLNCANSATGGIQRCSQGQICEAKEWHQPQSQQSTTNTQRGCTNVTAEAIEALQTPNECIAMDQSVPPTFTVIRCFCAYDRCNLKSMDKYNLRWDAGNQQQAKACIELSEFAENSFNGIFKRRPLLLLTLSIIWLGFVLTNF